MSVDKMFAPEFGLFVDAYSRLRKSLFLRLPIKFNSFAQHSNIGTDDSSGSQNLLIFSVQLIHSDST